MKFSKLQNKHEGLLELENDGHDINTEVKSFIKQAQKESTNYSPEERDNLRANLRHWAAYIFEKTGSYPDTELPPMAKPNVISLILQNIGKVLFVTIIVILCFWGLINISKIFSIVIQAPIPVPPKIIIYDQGGITIFLFALVIFLLIIMIIMRRRMSQLMSGVGTRVTAAVEGIRKTLVGGGKRGKPLATLKITDGPPAMIGQELKIYTEVVKLGRDPQRADMTFYGLDVNSSISGLHARIERVNGMWRIVAVSHAGSETFVDNHALPFNEPQPLMNGQIVRLGYLAQLPIIFAFSTIEAVESPVRKTEIDSDYSDDLRKTDLNDAIIPTGFSKKPDKKQEIKPQQQRQDDDIFNEFRDR